MTGTAQPDPAGSGLSLVSCDVLTPPSGNFSSSALACDTLEWPTNLPVVHLGAHSSVASGCTGVYDAASPYHADILGEMRRDNDFEGFTGAGYADFSSAPSGDGLRFNLSGCVAGEHTLKFRYRESIGVVRTLRLTVLGLAANGDEIRIVQTVNFGRDERIAVALWDQVDPWVVLTLKSASLVFGVGKHLLYLESAGSSGPKIDYLAVELAGGCY